MAVRNVGKTLESIQSVSLGQLGGNLITNTTEYTGDWAIITALQDTVFVLLTSSTMTLNSAVFGATNSLDGITLLKGMSLYGRFSALTLASGAVAAYSSGVAA